MENSSPDKFMQRRAHLSDLCQKKLDTYFWRTPAQISLYKEEHIYCKGVFTWMLSRSCRDIFSHPQDGLGVFEDIFASSADTKKD